MTKVISDEKIKIGDRVVYETRTLRVDVPILVELEVINKTTNGEALLLANISENSKSGNWQFWVAATSILGKVEKQ